MSDITLTKEEQKAIRSLERLSKRWPESLALFGWSGSLHVFKDDEDGRNCSVAAGISYNMSGDGGDPDTWFGDSDDTDSINTDPDIDYE